MALTSQQQLAGAADGLFEPSVGHFWSLLKPRVMSLVVFTGFAGMYVAPGSLHPLLFAIALFAIAAGAGRAARTGGIAAMTAQGSNRLYAEVIGDPIAQSKSPDIHNFWLHELQSCPSRFRSLI